MREDNNYSYSRFISHSHDHWTIMTQAKKEREREKKKAKDLPVFSSVISSPFSVNLGTFYVFCSKLRKFAPKKRRSREAKMAFVRICDGWPSLGFCKKKLKNETETMRQRKRQFLFGSLCNFKCVYVFWGDYSPYWATQWWADIKIGFLCKWRLSFSVVSTYFNLWLAERLFFVFFEIFEIEFWGFVVTFKIINVLTM